VGGGRKLRYLGQRRNEMWMLLTVSAYNLVRMANLEPVAGVKSLARAGGRERTEQPHRLSRAQFFAVLDVASLSRARSAS
jgi:hypothetical protein